MQHPYLETIPQWISSGRFGSYLDAAGGDRSKAWSLGEINRLRSTGQTRDAQVADIIEASRKLGWTDGRYQVFGLTRPGTEGHLTLRQPVPHLARGRGSAFTQGQRYIVRDRLRRAATTSDI
ncbi:hypothetical protein [Micromonospora profundi]|uniref:hypothetical protein n=1 Tax=Micromonospora profundi TaxID=1420889 RepID=UPI00365CC11F